MLLVLGLFTPVAAAGALEIDHTGNWAFWDDDDGDLTMTTPQADYLYKPASC